MYGEKYMIYELHYDNTNTYMISGNDGMLLFDMCCPGFCQFTRTGC